VLSGISVAIKSATVIAVSVIPIPVQHCAMITALKYAKGFQSLRMFATVVKIKDHVHWKKGFIQQRMHKKNTRQSVPSLVKGYSLQKMML
jgi:hypothetical protein